MVLKTKSQLKKKKLTISIVLMQNGVIIAERRYSLAESVRVSLNATRDTKSKIMLPNYHFYDGKEDIMEIKGRKVFLKASAAWSGLGTSRGEVVECSSEILRTNEIELERDDYFTLSYRDLRVLIKVTPFMTGDKYELEKKQPGYSESFIKIFISSPQERNSLIAATFIAIFLMSSLSGGLYLSKFERPTSVRDINEQYVVPFIAPRLIQLAPELLKEKLNVSQIVNSSIDYSNAIVDTLLGKKSEAAAYYLDRETISINQKMHAESRLEFDKSREIQLSSDRFQESKPGVKLVAVPVVAGESLDGTVNRALDKMGIILNGAEKALQLRREIVPSFQDDSKHTFEDYQNVQENSHKADALKDIKPWIKITTEQQLYGLVERLAKKAGAGAQKSAPSGREFFAKYPEPIGVVPGSKFLTFNVDLTELDDRYLDFIDAKNYMVPEKKVVKKEALSGYIETERVENFITLNKYQLQICYEIALRRDESSEGIMEWTWKVDSKGRIFDIELIANNINDDKMVKCIREKISQWRFPHPKNGAIQISFPFEFVPSKG